ncbi:alpha/beta hydrolase [Mycolicibacterium chubuense]|uniref:Non-heme chloroperoxidase n=1 Tax=Mycolicibacterium chubuense TaxID=1800 RepID=A0A0J6WS79_MYCCU|nr:alpha/beta hydrolase [Mycolicibacterium chubuense]KMO84607.1 Non-heme chloroperoxidase [Mycolicibacterium chubuense]ORA45890.1 alpha/beta hydrolase [Mycolicibacterium chubuense]SPY00624.1 putative hydrolase or acyltransferase of alpha/beta superfamily [Mycolicibacterium chubuense]
MATRGGVRRRVAGFAPAQSLAHGRVVDVRSRDGVRLHTEVFGPEDGSPVVLAHGITCALRVWAYQIADLARHHRVIAFDHRGHGRSGVPAGRGGYSLDHLAADLDAVLDATLAPGERAVIAGHSMGGIAITSWAERHPDQVAQRAAAVALINTTTGDLLRHVNLLPVPASLAEARVRAAGTVLRTFGGAPLVRAADRPSRRFVQMIAVGRDADAAVVDFVFELFHTTPAAGRGGWARVLVDHLGPQHIGLKNLTVPTMVIGSAKDRLLPIVSSRRIAATAPNLARFVELPGGHCAILERPSEVNEQLRWLIETVDAQERRVSS